MGRIRAWLWKLSAYRIAVFVGVVLASGHALRNGRLDDLPVIGQLERIFHDLKFQERGVRRPSGDVFVAAVDEKAIATIGRWPFARSDVAQLVDKLTALGAKAVVFDVAYTDAAFEGPSAVARKLSTRFDDVSFAGSRAQEVISRLSFARTDAAGALEAARALKDGSTAARDVRQRLEPVARAVDEALRELEAYRSQHAEYGASLRREVEFKSSDEQLADAVHRSGKVVLGSFLLTEKESQEMAPADRAQTLKAVHHVSLAAPSPQPLGGPDTEVLGGGPSIDDVPIPTYAAARAPFEGLLKSPDSPVRASIAFFNTLPDADGVIRREPLVLSVGDPRKGEPRVYLPSLDLGALLKYYDADPFYTYLWTNGDASDQLEYVAFLPGSGRGVDGSPRLGDFRKVPVSPRGELLLNYYGPDGTFPNISLGDVWNGQVHRDQVEGRIALFGVTATATFDQRVTPFSALSPGVEIHATAIENILHEDYLVRPWWATVVECLLLLIVALGVGRLLSRLSVVSGAPVALAVMGLYHLIDNVLFRSGIQVFSAVPLLEVAGIYMLQTVYRYSTEEREKRHIRKAFQLYLTKSVMEEMLKDPSKLKLGGEKRVLTVLFSDIRGFTSISEQLAPERLAKLINEYLTPMTNLVFEHGGTLDKYIGDAVMAIYGAPVSQEDHALRCCRTAVAMVRELARLQERWRVEGQDYPPLEIGIGIHSGPMVVGNMGADQRFDYTVLGDNVNLASRLEGTNKDYRSRIIVSEATLGMCGGQLAARRLGAVRVKGRKEPVRIFELLDDQPASGEIAEVIALFDEGVARFAEQKWDEARTRFRAVLKLRPDDGPSLAYLDFCDELEAHPPGKDWDGVHSMAHK